MEYDNNFEKIILNNTIFFRCNKCKKTFNKKNNAKRHLNNKFDCSESVYYECNNCKKRFNDKSKYSRHIHSCFIKNNEKYTQTDLLNNNNFEILANLYIPEHIVEFMINIYFKYPNNSEIDITNFFVKKNENSIQELFSFLIKKTKKLNLDTLFNIHKIINKTISNNFIKSWNQKLYEEIIKSVNSS